MIEREVKDRVKRLLAAHGAYYYMLVPTGYGRKGVPDFLICHEGRFIAVETKVPGKRPTPHQEKELAAIRAAGGIALVIDGTNMEELEDVLARRP